MSMWIVTSSYNDYDQHGEYFICAFECKPTAEQIHEAEPDISIERAEEMLENGGRRHNNEYVWYDLYEVSDGERI